MLALDVLTFLTSAATLAAIRVRPAARLGQPIGLRADLAAGRRATGRARRADRHRHLRARPGGGERVPDGRRRRPRRRRLRRPWRGENGLLLGIAGVAEVLGALTLARLPLRNLALTAVLAWALLGAFRFPLGLAETPLGAAVLLAMTGFASALTDIPLIALVQQRIPDRHLAKALGLWEAGIAGALAVAPFVAAATIEHVGVRSAFMLSGAALIALAAIAATAITRATATPPRRASTAEAQALPSSPSLEDVAG